MDNVMRIVASKADSKSKAAPENLSRPSRFIVKLFASRLIVEIFLIPPIRKPPDKERAIATSVSEGDNIMASEGDGWELTFISRREFKVQLIVGSQPRRAIIANVPKEPSATSMATSMRAPCRAYSRSLIESRLIVDLFFGNEYWNEEYVRRIAPIRIANDNLIVESNQDRKLDG